MYDSETETEALIQIFNNVDLDTFNKMWEHRVLEGLVDIRAKRIEERRSKAVMSELIGD